MSMKQIGKCVYCNCIVENGVNGVRVKIACRGNGHSHAYLCERHSTTWGDESYSTKNDKRRGQEYSFSLNTYSMELECNNPTPTLRAELLNMDFIPTEDCTTSTEFKSPIYNSLKPIGKKLRTIEKLNNEYNIIGSGDGTHLHVGHRELINPQTMRHVRTWYHSLFVPLCEFLQEHPTETKELFGRNFVGYAHTIDYDTDEMSHSNFINMQHDYTIEYRLCKFVSAKQYQNLTHLCKKYTNCICDNLLKNYDSLTLKQKRQKSKVVGQKLVRLTKKAMGI